MHGYIDPFADRPPAKEDEPDDSRDEVWDGLAAIFADAEAGRREAPFAANPEHRVRPVGR